MIFLPLFPSSARGGPSSYSEGDKAQFFRYYPYSLAGMSLHGVGFWSDYQIQPSNPVSFNYTEDFSLFPVMNLSYEISGDERNFYNTVDDKAGPGSIIHLTSAEFEAFRDRDYFVRSFWQPLSFKKGRWFFNISALLTKEYCLIPDRSASLPPDSVAALANIAYSTDMGVRVGQANELINEEWIHFSLGWVLNLALNSSSRDISYDSGTAYNKFINPLPEEMGKMETAVGYAVDVGAGGIIPPLHLQYSFMAEGVLGQLHYKKIQPYYHLGAGWRACLSDTAGAPDYNFTCGLEFYRVGELNFRESFRAGAEIKFHGIFIRGGYRDAGPSTGVGLRLRKLDINYSYFPRVVTGRGDTSYRHGVEFYIRL